MAVSCQTNILQRVACVIEQRELAENNTPVLLMVSGGSDSTALCYIARELHDAGLFGEVALLHVNHKLRGQDAEDDARFVAKLADILGFSLFSVETDIARIVTDTGENMEAVARHERYRAANEALEELCRHTSVPVTEGRIATAHTLDDRAENFYMRSIVGTGPGGFRAMRYRNGQIIRPLLDESRESLRAYIMQRDNEGLPVARDDEDALWREDATNAHTDHFRAYVRREILPNIKQWNDQALESLARTMNLIADEDDMLDTMAADIEQRCVQGISCDLPYPSDLSEGFLLLPDMGTEPRPLQRRVVHRLLARMLGDDVRIDSASVEAVLDGFADGKPCGGYVVNIQGDLAVSANKAGVRVEPMAKFRARRKRTKK